MAPRITDIMLQPEHVFQNEESSLPSHTVTPGSASYGGSRAQCVCYQMTCNVFERTMISRYATQPSLFSLKPQPVPLTALHCISPLLNLDPLLKGDKTKLRDHQSNFSQYYHGAQGFPHYRSASSPSKPSFPQTPLPANIKGPALLLNRRPRPLSRNE